jgi:hypothetical protein
VDGINPGLYSLESDLTVIHSKQVTLNLQISQQKGVQ